MRESTKVYFAEFVTGVLIGTALIGLWHLIVDRRK